MKNKVLLASGTLYNYGLNRFFSFAKRAGFDGIELILDNSWDTRQPHYIKKLEKDSRIRVLSVHCAMEFVSCLGDDPKKRLAKSIDIAKKTGAKLIVVHPADSKDKAFFSWVRKNYKTIIASAKPLITTFENHTGASGNIDSEFFGIFPHYTLDTSNIATTQSDLIVIYLKNADKIKHIHLSDSDFAKKTDSPDLIDDRHLIPGTGKLPLKNFLKAVKQSGYGGYITIELVPESVGAGKSDTIVLGNLERALSFTKKNLA